MTRTASAEIIQNFDRAASSYDEQASLQTRVAEQLVRWANPFGTKPETILDLGCGTGFVAKSVVKRWPQALVTALDPSPAMLQRAQMRVRILQTIEADILQHMPDKKFDFIFSSMMLHWLPDPLKALQRWKTWLKPGGHLYIALLTQGSFWQWRNLCELSSIKDGLWKMPPENFAIDLANRAQSEMITVDYDSAHAFLKRLKMTGTATPRRGHKPVSIGKMRQALTEAPEPFAVTYRVLYLDISSDSV